MKRRTKLVLAGVLLFITVLILAFYGRSDRAMRFGTAGIGGVYYNFGQEFGDFLSAEGLKIDVKETAGSAANLRLLSGGFIQIAIAQTDVLNDAWTGTRMFDGQRSAAGLQRGGESVYGSMPGGDDCSVRDRKRPGSFGEKGQYR